MTKVESVTLSINILDGLLIFSCEDTTPDVDIEPSTRFFMASSFNPTSLEVVSVFTSKDVIQRDSG
jgi:hypothetical protein